jgi:hypothetical protein
VEECFGLALGFGDYGGGDAVVRDVEEARVFSGVAYSRREGFAGGEVRAADGAEVDKGDFVGVAFAGW